MGSIESCWIGRWLRRKARGKSHSFRFRTMKAKVIVNRQVLRFRAVERLNVLFSGTSSASLFARYDRTSARGRYNSFVRVATSDNYSCCWTYFSTANVWQTLGQHGLDSRRARSVCVFTDFSSGLEYLSTTTTTTTINKLTNLRWLPETIRTKHSNQTNKIGS